MWAFEQNVKCQLSSISDCSTLSTIPHSHPAVGGRDSPASAATYRTCNRARHSPDTTRRQKCTDKITHRVATSSLPTFIKARDMVPHVNFTYMVQYITPDVCHQLKVLMYTLNHTLQHKFPSCWTLVVSKCGNVWKKMDWYNVGNGTLQVFNST